jgi:hypothetical protein
MAEDMQKAQDLGGSSTGQQGDHHPPADRHRVGADAAAHRHWATQRTTAHLPDRRAPAGRGRYIVQAFPNAAWVTNARAAARAADTVTLTRGRRSSNARLTEVPVEERRPLLREVVETQPTSAAKRYVTNGLAEAPTPDAVAAAADRIAVFRIERSENRRRAVGRLAEDRGFTQGVGKVR